VRFDGGDQKVIPQPHSKRISHDMCLNIEDSPPSVLDPLLQLQHYVTIFLMFLGCENVCILAAKEEKLTVMMQAFIIQGCGTIVNHSYLCSRM